MTSKKMKAMKAKMMVEMRTEFARLGGHARAEKLGKEGLAQHAHKMVEARRVKRENRAQAENGER